MAVIFDEVTADVHPAARGAPVAPQPEGLAGKLDPSELSRELERQAERQARLRTD